MSLDTRLWCLFQFSTIATCAVILYYYITAVMLKLTYMTIINCLGITSDFTVIKTLKAFKRAG